MKMEDNDYNDYFNVLMIMLIVGNENGNVSITIY